MSPSGLSAFIHAAALALPLAIAATPAQSNTPASAETPAKSDSRLPQTGRIPAFEKETELPANSCKARIQSYFDDSVPLATLNNDLGEMSQWIARKNLDGEALVTAYAKRMPAALDEADTIRTSFQQFAAFSRAYSAGAPEGLAYLKKDPVRAIVVLSTYEDMATALRATLDSEAYMDFAKTFGGTVETIARTRHQAQTAIVRQISEGCVPLQSSPAPSAM